MASLKKNGVQKKIKNTSGIYDKMALIKEWQFVVLWVLCFIHIKVHA